MNKKRDITKVCRKWMEVKYTLYIHACEIMFHDKPILKGLDEKKSFLVIIQSNFNFKKNPDLDPTP